MKSQEMQQQQPTSKNNKSERMVTSLSTKKKNSLFIFLSSRCLSFDDYDDVIRM